MEESHELSCCLCGKYDHTSTQYAKCYEDEKYFIKKHHGTLPESARICKKHKIEASRYYANEDYVPKWKRKDMKQIKSCMFPNCSTTSEHSKVSQATFAPIEQLQSITGITKSSILLCKTHYSEVYKIINSERCAFCHGKSKPSKPFSRHSPDSEVISKIYGIEITNNDALCLVCYKAHLILLKEIECNTDTFLQCDIAKWQFAESASNTDKLRKCILQTVILLLSNFYRKKHCYLVLPLFSLLRHIQKE